MRRGANSCARQRVSIQAPALDTEYAPADGRLAAMLASTTIEPPDSGMADAAAVAVRNTPVTLTSSTKRKCAGSRSSSELNDPVRPGWALTPADATTAS